MTKSGYVGLIKQGGVQIIRAPHAVLNPDRNKVKKSGDLRAGK